MKRVIFIVAAISLWTFFPPSLTFGCECEPRTAPEKREGAIKKTPSYDFSWFSDADKRKDDQYCYERVVTNKHDNLNLDYEWQIAEMDNKALPPKERDRICKVRGTPREPAANGPLTYGRNNPPTETEVWKAKTEPRTGETQQVATFLPLETMLEFVFAVGKRVFRNSIMVRSFATALNTPSGRVFRYSYMLENLSKEAPVVSWDVPGLSNRIKGDPRLAPMIRSTERGLALEIRDVIAIPIDDKQPPVLGTFPVYFFTPDGKRITTGSAEAYMSPR